MQTKVCLKVVRYQIMYLASYCALTTQECFALLDLNLAKSMPHELYYNQQQSSEQVLFQMEAILWFSILNVLVFSPHKSKIKQTKS